MLQRKKKKKKKAAADELEDVVEKIRQISLNEELDRETLLQQIELAKQNGAINYLSDLLFDCVTKAKAEALEILCAQKEIGYDKKLLLQAVITSGANNEEPCLLESEKIAVIKAMIKASQLKIIRKAINDCTWGPERKDKMQLVSCPVHMNQPILLQFLIKECGVAISGDSGILTMRAAALQKRKECLGIILDNVDFERFVLENDAALRVFNDALTSFAVYGGDILYEINDDSIACAQMILDRCRDARQRKTLTKYAAELAEIAIAQQDGGKALKFLLKIGINPNPEPPSENYVCNIVRNARSINMLFLLIAHGANLDCQEVREMVANLEKEQPLDQKHSDGDLAVYKNIVLKIITHCQKNEFDVEIESGVPKIIDFVVDHGNALGLRCILGKTEINQRQFINFVTRALMVGNKEIAKELLQRTKLLKTVINNLIEISDPQSGSRKTTLLQIAISHQNVEAVRILLQNKARVDICDSAGTTALSDACGINGEEISHLVIKEAAKKGGLCNIPDQAGDRPLQIAVSCQNVAAVEALTKVKDIDVDLNAPIFVAIYLYYQNKTQNQDASSYLKIVNLLLEKGANVNLLAKDGKSPLYFAVASNNADLVRKIFDKISNKSILYELKTAIEDPQVDAEILQILLDSGAAYQELFTDGKLLFDASYPDIQQKIAILQAHEKKDKAATKIQTAFRDHLIKKELKRQQEEVQQQENAATKIQTALRGHQARKKFIATRGAMQLEMQDHQIKSFLQTDSKIQSIKDMPKFLQERIMNLVRRDNALVLVKGSAIHKKSPKDLDLEIFIADIAQLTDSQIEALIKEKLGIEVKEVYSYRSHNSFTLNFKCGLLDISIYDSKLPPNENYEWTSSFDAARLSFDESGVVTSLVTKGCEKHCATIGVNPHDNFVVNPCSRDRFLRACLLLTNGTATIKQVFAGFDKVVENANYWQNAFDTGRMKEISENAIMDHKRNIIIEPDFIGKCVMDKVGVVATNAAVSILQKFKCLDNHCNLLRMPKETTEEIKKGLIKFCEDHDLNGQLRKNFFENLEKFMKRYNETYPKNLHPSILQQQEVFFELLVCANKAVEDCLQNSLTEAQENLGQNQNPQPPEHPSASTINLETRAAKGQTKAIENRICDSQ